MKPVIRETVVAYIKHEELDLLVQDEILGVNPDGHDFDWEQDYDLEKYWKSNEHIPIDMLVETVNKLKADGATYVQIMPLPDPYGYHFTGVKLEIMKEADVKEKKKEKLEKAIKNQEIAMNYNRDELAKSVDYLGKLYEELERLNENL